MSVEVKLNNTSFDKSRISIQKGKDIKFKSEDGKTYVVDCGASDDPDISDQFPFTVVGDGKYHRLKVKNNAKQKDFTCTISLKEENTGREPTLEANWESTSEFSTETTLESSTESTVESTSSGSTQSPSMIIKVE